MHCDVAERCAVCGTQVSSTFLRVAVPFFPGSKRSTWDLDPKWTRHGKKKVLGVDAFSILFNHRSFPKTRCFPRVFGGFYVLWAGMCIRKQVTLG